jgi:AraC-like DNA-binding protein
MNGDWNIGSGSELVNNKRHDLKPGTFSAILPYQVHSLNYSQEDPLSLYVGGISLDTLFSPAGALKGLDAIFFRAVEELPCFVQFEGEDSKRLVAIFLEMYSAYMEESVWGELLFKARLMEALVIFDRTRMACIGNNSGSSQNSPDSVHIDSVHAISDSANGDDFWKIVNFIHVNYEQLITLGILADKFHMSAPYISSCFKKQIGVNFLDFLNETRVNSACSLLLSTTMPITDIAYETGFDSYTTFSRVFRGHRGISARDYRKKQ